MPEGVRPYPRWDGPLATGPRVGVVAMDVVQRTFRNLWSQLALVFVAAYTIVYLGNLYQNRDAGDDVHTMDAFVDFLNNLRWGVLAIAAIIGAPAILDDQRRGALELYFSRAVNSGDYLFGKVLAVFGLCTLALFVPAVLYVVVSLFFFTQHPPGWPMALPGAFLYSLILAALVSGLALGLSTFSKNGRAMTLILGGAFVMLDLVVSNLLENITRDPKLQILSPFAAFQQQSEWIFQGIESGAEFPLWWGVLEVAALTIVGWILLVWKRPRVRGDEPGRA